ncbi:helix-turn-helix domain-containing protein [Streptomyces sp. NPDC000345]|uniref:helix-turn-helix domain-containing protein n=1 Tax=Streptomyces sp. NPDC000345 TaxID=3364537 RepID=UPI0036A5778A
MKQDDVPEPVDARLGRRLAELRAERGWSLGDLAERSGISRSTLSRAERAEISPTAALLNRLCHVYGRTMSRLLSEVEEEPAPLLRAAEQPVWEDKASGFVRRSVSPPHPGLRGELVEGRLAAGADIAYDRPPVSGLEQHIWVLEGSLAVTAQDVEHRLDAGDCLRLRVAGPTRFRCAGGTQARYVLAVVLP